MAGYKSKKAKTIKQEYFVRETKEPRCIEQPESYYAKFPVWSFAFCDFEHSEWGLCKSGECVENILNKLKGYEGMRWNEIFSDTSGRKNNTKNHCVEVARIIKEARNRLYDLNLGEYDTLYSLTITGKQRLWGIMNSGVFCVIWFDKHHKICPSSKRHT